MNRVIIALPAYNEEKGLPKLLDKIIALKSNFEKELYLVVVNDGSSDNTKQVLEHYSTKYSFVSYIDHQKNKGLGEAMKTLFAYVLREYRDEDIAVTLDADNTHHPKIIPAMVQQLEDDSLDVVIASRFAAGGEEKGLSPLRKLYSRGARSFFNLFFPIDNVNDYSSGYRAYRIGYVRRAFDLYNGNMISSKGFECMVEILARFSKIGVRAGEYPLVLEYNLKETRSKMNVRKTIAGYFKLVKKVKQPTRMISERKTHE